ncbi:hypothetical protein NLI96_g10326 [Meripilus lineatus]|uniref:Uncharacterized protein n=1 Tax=Meripilus lineatus TaxID=2056292 RepID=A0AAD5UVL7_9APHY|nr:hypothetical protein NLI96_g10326 [Physisporinus lineatus]
MQLKVPMILALTLTGVGLASAQATCDLCGASCPAGDTCQSFDISGILDNSTVQAILRLLGIVAPDIPAGTTVTVWLSPLVSVYNVYADTSIMVGVHPVLEFRLNHSFSIWVDVGCTGLRT